MQCDELQKWHTDWSEMLQVVGADMEESYREHFMESQTCYSGEQKVCQNMLKIQAKHYAFNVYRDGAIVQAGRTYMKIVQIKQNKTQRF